MKKKKIWKNFFSTRRFQTIFEQKCSNLKSLLSITFSQGFRIRLRESRAKRFLNGTSKVNKRTDRRTDRWTDGHADRHFDLQKASAERANAFKTQWRFLSISICFVIGGTLHIGQEIQCLLYAVDWDYEYYLYLYVCVQ